MEVAPNHSAHDGERARLPLTSGFDVAHVGDDEWKKALEEQEVTEAVGSGHHDLELAPIDTIRVDNPSSPDPDVASLEKVTNILGVDVERARRMLNQFAEQVKVAEQAVADKSGALDTLFERLKTAGVSDEEKTGILEQTIALQAELEKVEQIHASKTALYEKSRTAFEKQFGAFNPRTVN